MHALLNQDTPDDFVIGTGIDHSVRDLLNIAFSTLDLNFEDYLVVDPKFYRPAEVDILLANPKKAKEKLGRGPTVKFNDLIHSMVMHDYDELSK